MSVQSQGQGQSQSVAPTQIPIPVPTVEGLAELVEAQLRRKGVLTPSALLMAARKELGSGVTEEALAAVAKTHCVIIGDGMALVQAPDASTEEVRQHNDEARSEVKLSSCFRKTLCGPRQN